MTILCFRFAQDVLSTSPGDRRNSTERLVRPPSQISPRDSSGPALKPARPDLAKLSIVSPTKYGSSSASARDPRLKSPSLKSPSLKSPGTPAAAAAAAAAPGGFVKQRISPTVPAVHRTQPSPDPVTGSLMVKVNSHAEVKSKDPRLMTGLLAVAVPSGATSSSPASPSPKAGQRPPPPPHVPKAEEPKSNSKNLDERIKSLNEQYEKWSGSVRVGGPGRSDGSRSFNIDIKPNQPSAIVQKLLSRKSVFDDDSKRLETRDTEKLDGSSDEKAESSPASSGGFNTLGFKHSPVPPLKHGGDSPLLNTLDTPLFSPVNQFPSYPPRDTPPPPVVTAVMSPASTSARGPTKPLASPLLSRSPAPQSPSTPASPRGGGASSLSNRLYFPPPSPLPGQAKSLDMPTSRPAGEDLKQITSRPLPLPNKAGTAAISATVPIKPLVDRLGKPAAFTKPSATVTPTLKSTGMTASTARPTLSTVGSTKTISTSTMSPTTKPLPTHVIIPSVEKGEASSTTCSPKLESSLSANPTEPITTVQETDSDPNVTSTTKDPATEAKKKLDTPIPRDTIKSNKKEIDSLKDIKEELLFAPTLIQTKPKIDKLNKKFDMLDGLNTKDTKKSKDSSAYSKDRLKSGKDSQKHKQKMKHNNELKDFLSATATIRKETTKKEEKKSSTTDKDDKKPEKKRRLSSNSEIEELEPKSKQMKLKQEADPETEPRKIKSESSATPGPTAKLSMGRIPKLEKADKPEHKSEHKKEDKSKESKHKHVSSSSSSKSKSRHDSEKPEKHRHKSERREDKDAEREKAKKKKSSKHDEDKEKVRRHEKSKSMSLSTDDEKMKRDKELKKQKESKRKEEKEPKGSERDKERRDKDKEHKSKENKDKNREKDRDKEREKEKERNKEKERERERRERKRKKDEERKKSEQAKKKKKLEHDSSSDEEGSSDDSKPKFSIFDEPIFDVNNPIYFSMYDKVSLAPSGQVEKWTICTKSFLKLQDQYI